MLVIYSKVVLDVPNKRFSLPFVVKQVHTIIEIQNEARGLWLSYQYSIEFRHGDDAFLKTIVWDKYHVTCRIGTKQFASGFVGLPSGRPEALGPALLGLSCTGPHSPQQSVLNLKKCSPYRGWGKLKVFHWEHLLVIIVTKVAIQRVCIYYQGGIFFENVQYRDQQR